MGEEKGKVWDEGMTLKGRQTLTISPSVLLFPGHPAVFTEMVLLLPGAVFLSDLHLRPRTEYHNT